MSPLIVNSHIVHVTVYKKHEFISFVHTNAHLSLLKMKMIALQTLRVFIYSALFFALSAV